MCLGLCYLSLCVQLGRVKAHTDHWPPNSHTGLLSFCLRQFFLYSFYLLLYIPREKGTSMHKSAITWCALHRLTPFLLQCLVQEPKAHKLPIGLGHSQLVGPQPIEHGPGHIETQLDWLWNQVSHTGVSHGALSKFATQGSFEIYAHLGVQSPPSAKLHYKRRGKSTYGFW